MILVIGSRLGQAQGTCFFGRPWAVFWRLWDCTATITALSLKNWKYIGSERKQSKTRNLPLSISFSKVSSYIYASINNKATLYQHNFFPPKIQNGSRFLIFSRVKIHSFPKKNNSPLLTAIFVCKTIHYHFLKTKKNDVQKVSDINHALHYYNSLVFSDKFYEVIRYSLSASSILLLLSIE